MKQENRRFGEWVRTERNAKCWSQTDLGRRLRRSQGWVACVESGKLSVREDLREKLVDVLGPSIRKRDLHLDSVPSSARRRAARNTKDRCQIPLFSLEDATPGAIEDWIEQSPRYEISEVRDLLLDTQGAIHQIPKFLRCEGEGELNLKNIRGYFGRSSSGARGLADNIYQRLRCGYRDRKDSYGIILAVTSIKASGHFERRGIAYLERLKRMNGLCIANATVYPKGNVGATEPGFLYMTFKILPQVEQYAKKETQREIHDEIDQMMKEPGVNQLGSRVEVKACFSEALRQANEPSYTGNNKLKFVWPKKPNRKCA